MLGNINNFTWPYDIFKPFSSYALCHKIFFYTLSKILFLPSRVFFHHFCQNEYPGKHSFLNSIKEVVEDPSCLLYQIAFVLQENGTLTLNKKVLSIIESLLFEHFANAVSYYPAIDAHPFLPWG